MSSRSTTAIASQKKRKRPMTGKRSAPEEDSKKNKEQGHRRNAKKKEEDEYSDSSSDDDSDDDDEYEHPDLPEDQEIIDLNFDLCDPKEDDYHCVKLFLKTYLAGAKGHKDKPFEMSEVADLIVGQPTVGSVIRIEESEGSFGFTSVLNAREHKDKKCVKQTLHHVTQVAEKYATATQRDQLKEVIDGKSGLGLVMSERMVNVPQQLAPHLYRTMVEEIGWEREDAEKEGLKCKFEFKYLLFICPVYRLANAGPAQNQNKKKKKKRRKGPQAAAAAAAAATAASAQTFFTREEEEILNRNALISFEYPVVLHDQEKRWTLQGSIRDGRKVIVVEYRKMDAIVKQMLALFEAQ
eukprot:TRINITY_DN415_c3_g1_i2.p1 TRINITY_DN415_c3_g1~~TRINITY_DN415_c3_g1_i2.p1  ORF type:complete len:352 (-),score=114.49 TRINITY_DN415_c3_g1_i2:93-1148(-)